MKIFDIDWGLANIRQHGFFGLTVKIVIKFHRVLNLKIEKVMFYFGIHYVDEKELLSESNFDSLEALVEHFDTRNKPLFFINPKFRTQYTQLLSQQYKDEILNQASKILSHEFRILGAEVEFDKQIDWHLDPKSGYRWQEKFYADLLPVFNTTDNTDGKIPYELSRLQHFVFLGIAYWFNGDEKYTVEFIKELEDWIKENPYLVGVNWTCTMDVAIRAVNIIWGYHFFENSQKLTKHFKTKFLKSILEHGRYIFSHLENTSSITSNHYLSDIVGLVYLGVMFPEFKEAKEWREFGIQELISEMKKQIYEDGVDFEASISYHRLVTELFLSATILCLKNDVSFPDWYIQRLEKMIDFVMYYTKPDGTAPQIGDNDDGRLHILSNYGNWSRLDHRYLLSIGAILFNRSDFKKASGELYEEVLWLFGKEGIIRWKGLI